MRRPSMRFRLGWWDMELANRAFDLVVKIGAILAAVAAINLLGPEPDLATRSTCHVTADAKVIAEQYRATGDRPPGWLAEAVQRLRTTGRVPSGASLSLGGASLGVGPGQSQPPFRISSGRLFISTDPSPLTQKSRCAPLTVSRTFGGLRGDFSIQPRRFPPAAPHRLTNGAAAAVLRRARPLLGRSFADYLIAATGRGAQIYFVRSDRMNFVIPSLHTDATARSAVAAATRIAADVRVRNLGRGGATNVRVEAPAPYEPVREVPPFDLAPDESRLLRFMVPADQTSAAPLRPEFRSFGDKKRSVNTRLLVVIGVGLGLLAAVAFLNDVRRLRGRRLPSPEKRG